VGKQTKVPGLSGHEYRELATRIGEVVRNTRLSVARGELIRLAANYHGPNTWITARCTGDMPSQFG
jgi:hypothetical protein